MDAAQLAQLIEAMTSMTTALRNQPSDQRRTNSINIISNFDPFDSKMEQFKNYKERLEIHFQIKNIFEDKVMCARLLLQFIGSSNYALLTSLAAPKNINELTYDQLIELLEKHYCPKKNSLVEQHYFLSEYQNEKDSINEYVAKLRQRVIHSNFNCTCGKSIANVFLRAQLIRGLRDNTIREKLLQEENLEFDKIVEKAINLEASKVDCKLISNKLNSSNVEINKIKNSNYRQQNQNQSSNRQSHQRSKSKSSKSFIDYKSLGIEGLCLRCGRDNHLANDCKTNRNQLNCEHCKKPGHVKRVCIKNLLSKSNQKTNAITSYATDNEDYNYSDNIQHLNQIIDVYGKSDINSIDNRKFFIDVLINGKQQEFEVDSGAGLTLLPEKDFYKLNIKVPMNKVDVGFRSYTGEVFAPIGMVAVQVTYQNKTSKEEMYIVPSRYAPLLGRVWIRHLNVNLQQIDQPVRHLSNEVFTIDSITELMTKFSTIFEQRVGSVPNVVCSLKLKEKAKPVFVKHREVPFALRDKVEMELDDLEKDGIISKVNTSDWGSPLVVIPKPDGKVRLCVDYKVGVNSQLETAHYPIKRIDELLNNLRHSKFFCRLDLYKAYLHVRVDDESKQIQTISTHRGTYRMNRLSFGIKTAPSEFNRILDQILQGLEGTLSYFDDIIIHGRTVGECKQRLINCFEKLQEYDLHINKDKCEYFKEEIRYLGYVIRKNQILKSPDKIQAIKDMPRPKNSDEVRTFLGMTTYYSKFIPDLSTITFPLRQLLQKNNKFKWSSSCEAAFIKLKNEIMSDQILTPYDPKLQLTLACDASPFGIAAVLSHIDKESERPIAFISRALTSAEQNYSQLDREALAIVFAVDKFYMYIYGREFILITDNKPLTRIFHEHSKIPAMTSARLLRYASFLQGFNYKIQHKKAEEHLHVDCLSRSPTTGSFQKFKFFLDDEIKDLQDQIINQISTVSITAKSISKEIEKDLKLSKLKDELVKGKIENPDYTLQDGVIFKGNRVLIPENLQDEILKELHQTHIGIVRMKQLVRKYCYWNGIDSSIEKMVRACENCALVKNSPPKITTHHWDEPIENFDRVHMDYAGPFQGYNFFVLIDAKSKWPEIKVVKSAPSSEITIKFLQDIAATHGLPKVIVSDNASIFHSTEFKVFCQENGIVQKFIAPGHPATNGLAERHVKILKSKLNAMSEEEGSIHDKVRDILYSYRATPLSNGKSPAQQYLGREMRIRLDAIRPPKHEKSRNEKVTSRNLSVGDRVQSRFYSSGKPGWKFGIIKKKFGHLHYEVELDNGYVIKRHINQLYKSNVAVPKKNKVTFQEDQPKRSEPRLDEIQIQFDEDPVIPRNTDDQTQPVAVPRNILAARRTGRNRRQPAYLQDYEQY